MTPRDGNGWTRCDRGHRHWGRYGAAGLLLAAPGGGASSRGAPGDAAPGDAAPGEGVPGEGVPGAGQVVLLHRRSGWGSHGGSWGLPGGARDSHESPVGAALREAAEECAIDPAAVMVHGILTDDHGGWAYQTVLATATEPLAAAAVSEETKEVAWVPADEVERLRLHPGFAFQWPELRRALCPLTLIVDAANVIGSRPDGWWRDRAGAAARLCAELASLAQRGLAAAEVPDAVDVPALDWWFPQVVVVLEGAAAAAPDPPAPAPGLHVVRASRSGDDEIVGQASALAGTRLVVTADRALRARCEAVGAAVVGPRWLIGLLASIS